MVAPRKEGFGNDDRPEGSGSQDRPLAGYSSQESRADGGSVPMERRTAGGLAERLRDALLDESEGDLLLDRGDVENGIVQWLRALDLQVLGACRAEDRLKPLLKLNISSGLEEDRLMAQLSQHFEATEVGMLARCLCIPLVSIRVGKINKQGNLLCPTSTRGHLNLSLLPSSNMRISFAGDDGSTERLALLSNNTESSEIVIEEISADSSSRSFLLKLPGSQDFYYWCADKSKVHGMELLSKMKDLLRRKPCLARLTGISESRLESFGAQLRSYLLCSSNTAEADPLSLSGELISLHTSDSDVHSSTSMASKSSRYRSIASHAAKAQPSHQCSLSPRPNTFKDAASRNSSSIRSGIKDKFKRRGDSYQSTFLSVSQLSLNSCAHPNVQCEQSVGGSDGCSSVPSVIQPEIPYVPSSLSASLPLLLSLPSPSLRVSSSYSPYYCWCPPCPSSLQYSITSPHLPITFDESLPLPPLSSLLSASRPPVSLCTSSLPPEIPTLSSLSFPSLLPEPFVRLPLPVTSFVTLPTSQQISTFTPFMSDPIVHIPVIGVCSSGQGYLVSAGSTISSAIPPLLSSFVNHPLIPCSESAVERSARETLRMLMASTSASGSSASCHELMEINRTDGDVSGISFSLLPRGSGCDVVATTGQGFCTGTVDIEAVVMGLSLVGLSTSEDDIRRSELELSNRDNCSDDDEGSDCKQDDSED